MASKRIVFSDELFPSLSGNTTNMKKPAGNEINLSNILRTEMSIVDKQRENEIRQKQEIEQRQKKEKTDIQIQKPVENIRIRKILRTMANIPVKLPEDYISPNIEDDDMGDMVVENITTNDDDSSSDDEY